MESVVRGAHGTRESANVRPFLPCQRLPGRRARPDALNYMKAAESQDGSEDKPSFASGLLPHEHAFSLSVAEQCDCLQKDLPRGVTAVTPAGPGLVLLTLRAGRADGYGARAWPLLVGGAGLGDEPELAKMMGVP